MPKSLVKFQNEIDRKLSKLTHNQCVFFSWLCAVRALPFLCTTKRSFSYWKKDKIQTNIYKIFDCIDFIFAHYQKGDANLDFKDIKYGNMDINDVISTTINSNPNSVAKAVINTIAYAAATVNNSSKAASVAAEIIKVAGSAQNNIDNFKRIVRNDIEAILNNNLNIISNETDIYGSTWSKFIDGLNRLKCGYWARLYTDIFVNQFQFSAKALEVLKRRISIPAEVREQGASAVAYYLENAEKQGLVYVQRETRLIILGSAGAGKTTLVKRLNGEHNYPAPKDSTHGVDTSVMLDCNGIKTHVWDFGGQVIYHASHRCFISENCVYILVVNARTEDNHDSNRIKYWLDTIRVYSDEKAKVFIIINEADNRKQNVEDYDLFKYGEYASLIQEIYSFNIGEDMNSVNEFKKGLAAYIETIGHQTFGQNDSRAIKEIKALFDQDTQILKADELEVILRNNGIQKKKDQRRAKDLFNTLGVALSYDFMESYVLDPYWISHGVYKVIDYLQKNKSKFINYNELDSVFVDEYGTYPEDKRKYILELMEYHKIGFRNKDGVHGLIVPCAASPFKPKDVIVDMKPDSLVTQVERDDLQEFPADFFYRYICANEDNIKKNGEIWAMWQTGMVLTEESASALVELIQNRRIEITVWGLRKEDYSKKLELLIDNLLKEYRFISYKEEQKRGGRLINFITLVFESISKGVAKALIETAASSVAKP